MKDMIATMQRQTHFISFRTICKQMEIGSAFIFEDLLPDLFAAFGIHLDFSET
jgi:hypothetical protein